MIRELGVRPLGAYLADALTAGFVAVFALDVARVLAHLRKKKGREKGADMCEI